MGQPRGSRRRVATTSSDEEDNDPKAASPVISRQEDEPVRSSKRTSGTRRPAKKANTARQPASEASTPEGSPQKSPAKAKATKGKGKTAGNETTKTNARPIYSFFNATTQRQQVLQPSRSPEKPAAPTDEPEAIDDDSGQEGAPITLSKGSSTALAILKRKTQHGEGSEEGSSLPPPAAQKFRKTSGGGRAPSFSILNEDKRPWTEQFAPIDLSEIAVHKRKVSDVRQWLETAANGRRQKVLVLKGAAGTGKTTAIKLLANDIGLDISEWRNPAGSDLMSDVSLSTAAQFEEFLRRAGKTVGLQLSTDPPRDTQGRGIPGEPYDGRNKRQILLIEEFPNTFSRTSSTLQSFRSAILQHVCSPPVTDGTATAIVMVISETLLSTSTAAADSFTAHRLLGPELLNHPYIDTIEFNPVAPTILTKALDTIIVKEARKSGRRKAPGPQVIKRLAETGDIRSAVASLEFLCLRGDEGDIWSSKVTFTKPKKARAESGMTKAEEEALQLISNRESSLGIFHAVGRVVYNNRIGPPQGDSLAQPPPWLPQHRRLKMPERNVDALMDELGTDTSTFFAALHENYALSCSCSSAEDTLDSLIGCSENISDADLLSLDRFSFGTRAFSGSAAENLRQDEISFQVAVRGLLFSLPSPVHRGVHPGGSKGDSHRMFFPNSLRLWKRREEIEGALELLIGKAQNGSLDDLARIWQTKQQAFGSGVESWKRSSAFERPPDGAGEPGAESLDSARCPATKMDMLLERLPYMVHIMHSQDGPLLDQIHSVSGVHRQAIMGGDVDDEVDAADDDTDFNALPEQWTTDRPDVDTQGGKWQPRGYHRAKRKPKLEGRLAMPVEAVVERLVLEDDDIIDD